ncbi:zinc finger protein 436-like [Wyeomyia smithii]|uniref:zinc finger protein 436-like n=1 Tax=Wyeomyia smithii TaxID=174621 RepID=UPI002468005F|nr:zinc finger protein 436-like [Wyeomyia smithii]
MICFCFLFRVGKLYIHIEFLLFLPCKRKSYSKLSNLVASFVISEMEDSTQIKVEELIIFDTLPTEEETPFASSDRCSGETTVTDALREGLIAVKQEPLTDTEISLFSSSNGNTDDDSTKKYVCEICNKKYNRKVNFDKHRKTHSGKHSFTCDMCNETFSTADRLEHHKSTHTGERKFKCEICDRRFFVKAKLLFHLKIHSTDCPHRCTVCDKKFTTGCHLVDHMRCHSNERNFKCDICGLSYKRPKALQSHIQKIHRVDPSLSETESSRLELTDNTPSYSCDICGKQFKHETSLRLHQYLHQSTLSLQCEVCKQAFHSTYAFKRHSKTHEKQLSCDVCDKTFTRVATLNRHKVLHGGEWKHKCELCGKAYPRKESIAKHLEKHTHAKKGSKNKTSRSV